MCVLTSFTCLLGERHEGSLVGDAARVLARLEVDVPLETPVGVPRVADDPVLRGVPHELQKREEGEGSGKEKTGREDGERSVIKREGEEDNGRDGEVSAV